jgi:tetratricopeptide (TPR) repeat protein
MPKIKLVFVVIAANILLAIGPYAYGIDSPDRGTSVNSNLHKNYIEALVNLKSIEHYFTGEPIYLNKDNDLKENLRKKLQKIIGHIEMWDIASPNNIETLFYLGKSCSYAHDLDVQGMWKKSVAAFDQLFAINPDNMEARLIQAKNYMDNKDYDRALAEYEYADKMKPHTSPLKFMAITKMYLKRTGDAKKDLQDYLKYAPADEQAKNMLEAINAGKISYE